MPRPISIKFFRSEIVRKKLEALPDALREPVRRALANAGDRLVQRAKSLVPVDHGILRDSIRWQFVKTEDGRFRAAIIVGPSGAYLKAHGRIPNLARWVEFGTVAQKKGERVAHLGRRGKVRMRRAQGDHAGTPPRPYMFPAWHSMKKQVRATIADAVNRALKTQAKKG